MRAGFPSRHSDIPESSVSSQQTTSRNSGVGGRLPNFHTVLVFSL